MWHGESPFQQIIVDSREHNDLADVVTPRL